MDSDVNAFIDLMEQILTGTAPPAHEAHSLEELMLSYGR